MSDARHDFYLKLLFDEALRDRFVQDRQATLALACLSGDDAAPFMNVDVVGLIVDAEQRRRYLMSALCRPYPLTAGALGSLRGGPRQLSRFLAHTELLAKVGDRTLAFGAHLEQAIGALDASPEVATLIGAFLAFEAALVRNAADLREAIGRGEAAPAPVALSRARAAKATLCLPAFFLATQLPCPPGVLRGALDGVGPGDVWQKIDGGLLSSDRLQTVARAQAVPVTMLARAVIKGATPQRAASGIAPLIEVSHLTVELAGLQGGLVRRFYEGTRLDDLPSSARRITLSLAEAGLLVARA